MVALRFSEGASMITNTTLELHAIVLEQYLGLQLPK